MLAHTCLKEYNNLCTYVVIVCITAEVSTCETNNQLVITPVTKQYSLDELLFQ